MQNSLLAFCFLLSSVANQYYVASFLVQAPQKLYPSQNQQFHDNTAFQRNGVSAKAKVSYRESTPSTRNRQTRYNGNNNTELNRLKFLYNQARGNLQESEMRATAAEHRVAMLQNKIKLLNNNASEIDNDGIQAFGLSKKNSTSNSDETIELKKKVVDLKELIKDFRIKMKKEIDNVNKAHQIEKTDWQKQTNKLKEDLDWAQTEHVKALAEVSELNAVIDDLTKNLSSLEEQSKNELNELKSNHASQISKLESEALEVENNLKAINLDLETKLNKEKALSENLRSDIVRIQKEALDEIAAIETKSNTKIFGLNTRLDFMERELSDRNDQIERLDEERASIRKLTKIQLSILKSRIVKRYKKILGKTKD